MDYPTKNNRLLKYDESVNNVWQRTVTYTYWNTGDVSNITIQDKDDPLGANQRRDLALYYRTRGQVHLAVWGTFTVDANGDPVAGSYVPSAAREFRYHADPRARYAWRDWNTNGGSTDHTTWTAAGPLHWTDCDGAEPYLDGDITFDAQQNPAVTVGVQLFGSAVQRTAATGATRYFHADLIGSTQLRSDAAGLAGAGSAVAYTAFGESVGAVPGDWPRYQYAGAHGYESGLLQLEGANGTAPIVLLHVGARWYQPGVGRFVQRDPIGLRGGVNVYLYCADNPVSLTDGSGCGFWAAVGGAFGGAVAGAIVGGLCGAGLPGAIIGAVVGAVLGGVGAIEGGYAGFGGSKSVDLGPVGLGAGGGIGVGARDDTGPYIYAYVCGHGEFWGGEINAGWMGTASFGGWHNGWVGEGGPTFGPEDDEWGVGVLGGNVGGPFGGIGVHRRGVEGGLLPW